MKQNLFRFSLFITLVLFVASCNKNHYQEDLKQEQSQAKEHITLDLSTNVVPLNVVDYNKLLDDNLRATYGPMYSRSRGYGQVPHLFVKEDELGKYSKSLTIRMGIINVDNGKVFYEKNRTQLSPNQEIPNNKPSWLLEGSEDTRQVLHTYLRYDNGFIKKKKPINLDLNAESCYGFIALGGYAKDKTQLEFDKSGKRDNSPNVKVYAVNNGDIEARYIPMMTAVTKLSVVGLGNNKTAHFAGNSNFKPRGSFIGVRLENKLGQRATIKSIKADNTSETPFYYRGAFEWDFAKDLSVQDKDLLKEKSSFYARFNGIEKQGDEVFPVQLPNKQPYILGTEALSTDSRTIYLWGYQREDRMGKPFKFKIVYTLEGSTDEVESKIISINPPKNGFFKDGTAYRITVELLDKNTSSSENSSNGNSGNSSENGSTTTETSVQKSPENLNGENLLDTDITSRWELPELEGGTNNYFVSHKTNGVTNYSVEYNVDKRHSRWVAFQFNENTQVNPSVNRHNKFKWLSPIPKEFAVEQSWYKTSTITYDRGHLASSEDRIFNQEANDQSFDYINMSPQLGGFNRGFYKKAEGLVQDWGQDRDFCDVLYVVKGGTIKDEQVFDERLKGIMVIPKYYFMAVIAKKGNKYQGIGLWMEHKKYPTGASVSEVLCSIDELEEKTGINFFCNIPDTIENQVEAENSNSHTWPRL